MSPCALCGVGAEDECSMECPSRGIDTGPEPAHTQYMTKTELVRIARNIGVPGSVSSMSKSALLEAIARRRAYLARPAADIPKCR